MRRVASIAASLLLLAACQAEPEQAPPPPPEMEQRAPSPYPDGPGFTTVDRSRARLRFQGRWLLHGAEGEEPAPLDVSDLDGERIVVEGKMMLGDPEPYRPRFRLLPPYPGCVQPRAPVPLSDKAIEVRSRDGKLIQVTDHVLLVEGTARRADGDDVVLRLEDALIEELDERAPIWPVHRH